MHTQPLETQQDPFHGLPPVHGWLAHSARTTHIVEGVKNYELNTELVSQSHSSSLPAELSPLDLNLRGNGESFQTRYMSDHPERLQCV